MHNQPKYFLMVLVGLSLILSLSVPNYSYSAIYPDRPIEVIVAWPPGGGADIITRTICKYAEKELGQQISIINLPGGNGAIGYRRSVTAKPDGYTLMNIQSSLVELEIQGIPDVSRANFIPIVAVASQSIPLITRTDSPFKSFEEFVAKCKESPGKYNVGGSPLRSNFHQAAVLFMNRAGINFNYVPTGGSPQTLAAVAGGHLDTAFLWLLNADSYLRSGEMLCFVIFSDKRLEKYPGIPTIKEKGFGDLTKIGKGYYGIGTQKGTPPQVVQILEQAFTKAYNNPKFQEDVQDKNKMELMTLNSSQFKGFLDEMYKIQQEALKLIDVPK